MTDEATAAVHDPKTGQIEIDTEAWDAMQGTRPAYTIVPVPRRSNVDPGETIHIDCYVNGYGPVARTKLQMNYPYPDLLTDEADKGEIAPSVSVDADSDPPGLVSTDPSGKSYGIGEWGATAILEP
jgi:hypothetical protein